MEKKKKAVEVLTVVTYIGTVLSAVLSLATRLRRPWLCLGVTAAVLAVGITGAALNASLPREERARPHAVKLFAVASPLSAAADVLALLLVEASIAFPTVGWLVIPALGLLAGSLIWSVGSPLLAGRRKKG